MARTPSRFPCGSMNKKSAAPYRNPLLFQRKERPRGAGGRAWLWYLAAFLAGALLIAGAYFAMYGGFFMVKDISVAGARLVPSSLVTSAVEADTVGANRIAAALGPQNILFWLLADRTPSLSSRFPEIRKVVVTPSFWDRTVSIAITERDVTGVLCKTATGECYGIDANDIVFTPVPTVEGSLILRFDDTSTSTVVLGNPYLQDPAWMQNIVSTLSIMEAGGFSPSSVRVDASSLEEWEAVLPSGLVFRFSLHFVPDNLAAVLKDIAAKTDIATLQYFDFRVKDRVYYK